MLLSGLSLEQMPQAEREFIEYAVDADTGHVEVCRALLAAGVNKNVRNEFGATALVLASSSGHVEIVRLLLDAGADKDVRSRSGKTALVYASVKGHVEIARMLLDAGADKNLQDRLSGQTALMAASFKGHVEIVRLLLEAGADKNLQTGLRETASQSQLPRAMPRSHACCWMLVPRRRTSKTGPARLLPCTHLPRVKIVRCLDAGAQKNLPLYREDLRSLSGETALLLDATTV